jgi:hypothetical protein
MKRIEQFRKRILSRNHLATLVMVVVALSFMTMLAWSPVQSVDHQVVDTPVFTLTPTLDSLTPQPTPIPQEWVDNREQTNGIIAGAVVLAIIIIGGTLHTISRNKDQM